MVDGRGLFWNVFGIAGSLHDARVLHLSGLSGLVDRGLLQPLETKNICGHVVGYSLLCNGAYPLKSWLLKLFMDSGRLMTQQLLFWFCLSCCSIAVKHAYGGWRCLLKRNDCHLNKVKSMVLTCCVLHNLCELKGDDFMEEWGVTVLQHPESALSSTVEAEGLHAQVFEYSDVTSWPIWILNVLSQIYCECLFATMTPFKKTKQKLASLK